MTLHTLQFGLARREAVRGTLLVASGRLVLGHGAHWGIWAPYLKLRRGTRVCVDVGGVTELDAAGIGLLVRVASELRLHECQVSVVAARPAERRMLEITGLLKPLGVWDSFLGMPPCGMSNLPPLHRLSSTYEEVA